MLININKKYIIFIFVINILSLFDCIVLKHSTKIIFNKNLKLKTSNDDVIKIRNNNCYIPLNKTYNNNIINFIDIDNNQHFETNNFLDGLKIIDDNIQFENYNDTIVKIKRSKMQRVDSDCNFNINKKNFFILNKNDVINIMNKWSFYNIECYELDNIFRFLFMFFYLNRNVKKIIGVYDYKNFCEYVLFFEYKYIENTGYRLFFKNNIKNPLLYYLDYNITKYVNIILHHSETLNNDNINRLINEDTIYV